MLENYDIYLKHFMGCNDLSLSLVLNQDKSEELEFELHEILCPNIVNKLEIFKKLPNTKWWMNKINEIEDIKNIYNSNVYIL